MLVYIIYQLLLKKAFKFETDDTQIFSQIHRFDPFDRFVTILKSKQVESYKKTCRKTTMTSQYTRIIHLSNNINYVYLITKIQLCIGNNKNQTRIQE